MLALARERRMCGTPHVVVANGRKCHEKFEVRRVKCEVVLASNFSLHPSNF
jgi:hypothetical protein